MIYYLLPPSEGKTPGGEKFSSTRKISFDLPLEIASKATQKDLKCTGKRYEEGIELNKSIEYGPVMLAIQRYSGVMYNAVGYESMSADGREYFDKHFLILSAMYGLVSPQDLVGNYKLPITTELKKRRGTKITNTLLEMLDEGDTIIDLLSGSYQKMIDRKKIEEAGIVYEVKEFFKPDGTKFTHGVKKVKGEWVRKKCEEN